jgi:hypothetical protein
MTDSADQHAFTMPKGGGGPMAMFFAPPPLSTILITRPSVPVYSFEPDACLSPAPDVMKTISDVDLDLWAREVLAAFDMLLSPPFAVPAALVDSKSGSSSLKSLLDRKGDLAAAIAARVTNVLSEPALDPVANKAIFTAASEAWRQHLLVLLQNAYAIDAIVQYAPDVTPLADGHANAPVSIPGLQRAYPAPPALRAQTFIPSGEAATSLAQAKKWTFRFTYGQAHTAQDYVGAVILLNVPKQSGLRSTTNDDGSDLFVLLARLVEVLPHLLELFTSELQAIDEATDPKSPAFVRAQNALSAFAMLTSGLDRAWTAWTPPPPPAHGGPGGDSPAFLAFSIREDSVPGPKDLPSLHVLRVTIECPASLPAGVPSAPALAFDGYQAACLERAAANGVQTAEWVYQKIDPLPGEALYLEWDAALKIGDRAVDLSGLDAIQYQNAWAGVSVVRNQHLVEGNPTRAPFVYRAPLVQFPEKLTPLLDSLTPIDVAAVPTGTPQDRALADHMEAFVNAFFEGSPSERQLTGLEVRYRYLLSSDQAPAVELPVQLLPPTEMATAGDPLVRTLASQVKAWYQATQPPTLGASFVFDLSAFSPLSNEPLPVVRVRALTLQLANVTDLAS